MKNQVGDEKPSTDAQAVETHPDMTPDEIAAFIAANRWKSAVTMPENPHEYCLRKRAVPDEYAFERLVLTIRRRGYRARYKKNYYTCLDFGEHFMWTMGWPLEQTVLINRKPLSAKHEHTVVLSSKRSKGRS